jgi:superfamily II DNA or RNA helicase
LRVLIIVPKNIILEDTWFRELYNFGFCFSDIGMYYGKIKEYCKITITNVQNLDMILLKMFNFVIFDELHNCTERTLEILEEHDFKYRIGLSATAERSDEGHWKFMKFFDYNVFKYSPQDALTDGILNPFRFTNIGVEMDSENMDRYTELTQEINMLLRVTRLRSNSGEKERAKARLYTIINDRKQIISNYERKFSVIQTIVTKHKKDKIIVFNNYNTQTNKCYWHLLECGIKSGIVHSGLSDTERQHALDSFAKDKINVLLTSKVLDEGYNLPSIDVGIIMAGDSTEKQTIQRMGRVLRKKNKESNLYQLYILNTVEEEYGNQRALLFRQLCNGYDEYNFMLDEQEFGWS